MDKKDYIELDDAINKALNRTRDSMHTAGMNYDIFGRAENAYHDAKDSFKKGKKFFEDIYRDASKHNNNTQKKERKSPKKTHPKQEVKTVSNSKYINKRPIKKVRGILYTVFGSIFSSGLGIASFVLVLTTGFSIPLKIVVGLFLGSALIAIRGNVLGNRARRFKQYVKCLNGNTFCTIKEIADATNQKEKYIVKDIRKMIRDNIFTEGHIDEQESYLMITNEVYEDYLKSQESLKKRKIEEEERKRIEAEEDEKNPQNKEIRRIINEGKEYIEAIKVANDAIPGEEISNKLYKLENIVSEIFKHIEKNPNKIVYVNKFLNHYLPITLKLVNSYRELNDQPVQGENITKAKNEIEGTLDMINSAFEKLLDDLFVDVAMDISTDISVLQTLFNQEGLTEDDFHKEK